MQEKYHLPHIVFGFLFGVLLTLIGTRWYYQRVVARITATASTSSSSDGVSEQALQTDMKLSMMVAFDQVGHGLESLSGSELDTAFLALMIPHHQGTIGMAQEVVARGEHLELKKMAQEVMDQQTKELQQLETWQKDWGYQK